MPERYEMVVIGAGPAGEKAAAQAAYFGHRVGQFRGNPQTDQLRFAPTVLAMPVSWKGTLQRMPIACTAITPRTVTCGSSIS